MKISTQEMREIIARFDSSVPFGQFTPEQRVEYVEATVAEKNADWAITLLRNLGNQYFLFMPEDQGMELTTFEKINLKKIILETDSPEVACSALLNLTQTDEEGPNLNLFNSEEIATLKRKAINIKNTRAARALMQEDWFLNFDENELVALQNVVENSSDPVFALELLGNTSDEDIETIERYKGIIIANSHNNPELAYNFLRFWKKSVSGNPPLKTPYLTRDEENQLRRTLVGSGSPLFSYLALAYLGGFSEGEQMVLKGNALRMDNPNEACRMLCDTNFIPFLLEADRARLKQIALKTKEKYSANDALKYIYDLTDQERAIFESTARSK